MGQTLMAPLLMKDTPGVVGRGELLPGAGGSTALAAAASSAWRTFFMASLASFMWKVLPCS